MAKATPEGVALRARLTPSSSTCAGFASGNVECWRDDTYGDLGNGTTGPLQLTPVASDATGIVKIAGGFGFSCALTSEGAVQCWGANGCGELGDGSNAGTSTIPVTTIAKGAVDVTAGVCEACALMDAWRVMCWGANLSDQLGVPAINTPSSNVPIEVPLPAPN